MDYVSTKWRGRKGREKGKMELGREARERREERKRYIPLRKSGLDS